MRWTKRDFLILLALMLALALVGRGQKAHGAEIAFDGLRLDGKFVQGGLVTGHAPPGSRVSLDGKAVALLPDGRFLIGFGRDARPTAELSVMLPGGARLGRTLKIKKRKFRIQHIDGLPPKLVTPPPAVMARIHADAALIRKARQTDTEKPMFDTGFIWPVKGPISGVYGSQRILNGKPRQPHFGVDIAAPRGSPIHATADGIVRVAVRDMYFTGGTVLIDHGYGLNSVYSHMQSVRVTPGQAVRQGEVIGTLGSTGRATGPHLDWRVNLYLTRLDPALLVLPMPKEVYEAYKARQKAKKARHKPRHKTPREAKAR